MNWQLGICDLREFRIKDAGAHWQASLDAMESAIKVGGRSLQDGDLQLRPELKLRIEIMRELLAARDNIEHVFTLRKELIPRVLYDRAAWLAHDGDFKAAAETLARMDDVDGLQSMHAYNNACGYCRCLKALAKNATLEQATRESLEQAYQEKAVAWLERAFREGFFSGAMQQGFLAQDQDLDPLRSNAKFTELAKRVTGQSDN